MSYIKVTEAGTKAVKSFMETLDMEYNKDNEEKVINDILGLLLTVHSNSVQLRTH